MTKAIKAEKLAIKQLFELEKDILKFEDKEKLKNICFGCIEIYKNIAINFNDTKLKNNVDKINKIIPLIKKEENIHKLRSYTIAAIDMLKKAKIHKFL